MNHLLSSRKPHLGHIRLEPTGLSRLRFFCVRLDINHFWLIQLVIIKHDLIYSCCVGLCFPCTDLFHWLNNNILINSNIVCNLCGHCGGCCCPHSSNHFPVHYLKSIDRQKSQVPINLPLNNLHDNRTKISNII